MANPQDSRVAAHDSVNVMNQVIRLFYFPGRRKGEKMKVSDLISSWTEEEKREHADLIVECLKREEFLNDLQGEMRRSEEELDKNLDDLVSRLSELALIVKANADQVATLYLRLVRPKGNA